MQVYLGEHCILKPQKFEVSDGTPLSPGSNIIRLLNNPFVTAHNAVVPMVLIQTREEVEALVDTVLGTAHAVVSATPSKKKKSKQEKLIAEHLVKERQKIRDYADELPALLSYARALLLREELQRKEKANTLKKGDRYEFEIGDRVWFSMPLRTDKQGREDSQIKKFQFRWSGPMRVIARSSDFNRYTVVEVLPDGRLLSRQANAARLRPYNLIPPRDTADKAARGVIDDDFAQEIELWKQFAVLQRRPRIKVAEGVNRELFKRFDSDVAEGQYDDPEFYVERLSGHSLDNTKEYEYKVKWLGQGPYHNTWLLESDIPTVIVKDYWNGVAKTDVKEYFKRLKHVATYGLPKRAKAIPRYTDATDNAGFPQSTSEVRSKGVIAPVPVVERNGAKARVSDQIVASNDSRDVSPLSPMTPKGVGECANYDDLPLALEDFVFMTLY
ncbi:hypothetical protein HDU67_004085 [Dinochytrium kinnereticum]|nr:hypothetical protein HDU67_004085 [Dinochytrium kinnereticum]